jgi:hypothetical protein
MCAFMSETNLTILLPNIIFKKISTRKLYSVIIYNLGFMQRSLKTLSFSSEPDLEHGSFFST